MVLACEKCRVLKVKCTRVEGQPCTKCQKSNSECTVPEPRQQARTRRAKPRLADLESKLTNIIGLLSGSNAASDEGQNLSIPPTLEVPDVDLHVGSEGTGWISHENVTDVSMVGALGTQETNFIQPLPQGSSRCSTNQNTSWIADLGLGPAVLQHLVDVFSRMSSFFPFVRVPDGLEVASWSEHRPFLFLAALEVASSRYRHLQAALSNAFKKTFSQRLIIAEEKDLDFLQGLLLHLAWFHFHFNPRSPQAYRYLQILISMAVDLGIEDLMADMIDGNPEPDDTYSREVWRASLGCYYISSVISTSSNKPNNLKLSGDVLRAALIFQRKREFETDELIYPLLKQQQFVDEVCETYRLERQQFNCSRLCAHAGRLVARLEEWWSSLSVDLRQNVLLLNGYHATKIRIFEMGIVYNYGQRRQHPKNAEDPTIPPASPMLISNLIICTESTRKYLDFFFSIPKSEYHNLPFSIWYQMVLAVFVLYRLSVGVTEVPEWDVSLTKQSLNVEEYLRVLSSHLQSIGTDTTVPTKTLFTMMHEIIASVETSYATAMVDSTLVHGTRHPHQSFSDGPALLARGRHRCPGMHNLRQSVNADSAEQPILQTAISAEIQLIEDEILWRDLFVTDTFSVTATIAPTH